MTKNYGPQINIYEALDNPYGPRVWVDTHDRESIIHELYPEYMVQSINFDIVGYLYRLSVNQLELNLHTN